MCAFVGAMGLECHFVLANPCPRVLEHSTVFGCIDLMLGVQKIIVILCNHYYNRVVTEYLHK